MNLAKRSTLLQRQITAAQNHVRNTWTRWPNDKPTRLKTEDTRTRI